MNLEDYRALFATVSLVLILVVAFPALSTVVSFPSGGERFSELWLLGPNHMAEGYPFNVGVGEEYSVFVGVSNHMGCSEYYMVCVKFRNQTQPLPDSLNSIPSPLNSTYEFQFFLADGETWESPLIFSVQGEPMFVGNISINEVVFPVSCSSTWESERNGFFYQLFFELWMYDGDSSSFRYHNRFVGIWLNTTVQEAAF